MVQKTFNMDRDVSSYVMVFEEWISSDVCKQTCDEIENAPWQQHTFYNPTDGSYNTRSGSRELDIAYGRGISTQSHIMQRIHDAYSEYLTRLQLPWFNSWSGFSEVRFNRYEESRLMAEHCDHIHSMFDGSRKGIPILSILGCLNDDYEGGDLIFWEQEKIELKAGQIMIFPSNFMYPHKVTEVTKGIRYSYVSWTW